MAGNAGKQTGNLAAKRTRNSPLAAVEPSGEILLFQHRIVAAELHFEESQFYGLRIEDLIFDLVFGKILRRFTHFTSSLGLRDGRNIILHNTLVKSIV